MIHLSKVARVILSILFLPGMLYAPEYILGIVGILIALIRLRVYSILYE